MSSLNRFDAPTALSGLSKQMASPRAICCNHISKSALATLSKRDLVNQCLLIHWRPTCDIRCTLLHSITSTFSLFQLQITLKYSRISFSHITRWAKQVAYPHSRAQTSFVLPYIRSCSKPLTEPLNRKGLCYFNPNPYHRSSRYTVIRMHKSEYWWGLVEGPVNSRSDSSGHTATFQILVNTPIFSQPYQLLQIYIEKGPKVCSINAMLSWSPSQWCVEHTCLAGKMPPVMPFPECPSHLPNTSTHSPLFT